MAQITLPKELADWVDAEVRAGRAASADDFVAAAVRERQKWDAFRQSLDEAEAEADAGGVADFDDVFSELRARYATS